MPLSPSLCEHSSCPGTHHKTTTIMTDSTTPPPPPPRTEAEDAKENGEPEEEEEEEDVPMPPAPPAPSAAVTAAAPPATVAAVAVAAPAQTGGGKRSPSDFLKTVLGRPVVVKLNSGIDYRGERFWVRKYLHPGHRGRNGKDRSRRRSYPQRLPAAFCRQDGVLICWPCVFCTYLWLCS